MSAKTLRMTPQARSTLISLPVAAVVFGFFAWMELIPCYGVLVLTIGSSAITFMIIGLGETDERSS